MKNIVKKLPIDIALRGLDAEGERQLEAKFAQLANWDDDENIRKRSFALEGMPGAYVWHVDDDLRIFFSENGDTITLLDLGTKRTIKMFGQRAGAKGWPRSSSPLHSIGAY